MRSLRAVVRTLWAFIATIVGFAVVSPVRNGTLRLRDHPPAIAGITWVIAGVIAVLVGGIVAANPLRESAHLIAVVDESGSSIVPDFLVPAFLFLLAVSIALVLAGSQRLRWWILRPLLLITCTAILGSLIATSATVSATLGTSSAWRLWVALAAVFAYCLLIWTGRTRAATDFFVLLALCLFIAVASYRGFIAGMAVVDNRFDLAATMTLLLALNTLATPLAFISGLNATKLGSSITERAGDFVAQRTPVRVASLILVAIIVWQGFGVMPRLVQRWSAFGPGDIVGAALGSASILSLCALMWWLAHRESGRPTVVEKDASEIASTVAQPIAYGLAAPLLINTVLGLAATVLGRWEGPQSALLGSMRPLASDTAAGIARGLVVVGIVMVAVRMITRGRPRTAAILLVDAVLLAVVFFAVPLLHAANLSWSAAALGDVGMAVGVVLFCWWGAHRTITVARMVVLYTVILLSALLRRADYFGVPFGFLLGASASAVLIVGLVWGFLTDGGEAHEGTRRTPRDGKLLLFMGSFLYGLAIAGWAVIGKQVELAEELTKSTELGVLTLGTGYIVIRILDSALDGRQPEPALRLDGDVEIRRGDQAGGTGREGIGQQHVPGVDETATSQR